MLRLVATLLIALLGTATAQAGPTIDAVRAAGHLACGVVTEPWDYTKADTHGRTDAFGTDICRAVSAAVLGDAGRVTVDGFPDEATGLAAVRDGHVALLVGASPNPGLAARYKVVFGQPMFFDGQGFLVHRDAGIAGLADLAGKQVCFIGGTPAEDDLHRALDPPGIRYLPFPFEEVGEMEAALVTGRCKAQTGDLSALVSGRSRFHGRVSSFVVLPDTITLDPLCPATREGDADWARVVDWVGFTLVWAEVLGVTQADAPARAKDGDELVRTLLGTRKSAMGGLGLPDGWGLKVIGAVGNYGEVFARDWGAVGLPRGRNLPWTAGGLLWAPPIR